MIMQSGGTWSRVPVDRDHRFRWSWSGRGEGV